MFYHRDHFIWVRYIAITPMKTFSLAMANIGLPGAHPSYMRQERLSK